MGSPPTERRVVLRGALAASAALATGCGTSIAVERVETSATAAPSSAVPTTAPFAPGPTVVPGAEPEVQAVPGFGAELAIPLADLDNLELGTPRYAPEARAWLARYPIEHIDAAAAIYSQAELNGMEVGIVALYQKCPHLGCRVPDCAVSGQFECPCHGSMYNPVGEKFGGPAPRGMDRFATRVEGDDLIILTGTIIQGPPIGTNTIAWEPAQLSCLAVPEPAEGE